MNHSAISNALTSSFKKAKVFDKAVESSRVSCSRIRMSVIIEIVSIGKENISTLATCFAKHSEAVCKKYYVRHFSEREAARISWSCYSMYKTSDDVKKASKMRADVIKKRPIASSKDIKRWLKEIMNKIKLLTNISIEDANLLKELENLQLHEDGL